MTDEKTADDSKTAIPEPERTGVDPNRVQSADLEIIPPDPAKTYGAMSTTLAEFVGVGIKGAAVPFLLTFQTALEERFKQVDDERKDALQRLDKVTSECNRQSNLVTMYRERLKAGWAGTISQQAMTTIGAALLGASIAELTSHPDRTLGLILLAVGGVLLLTGWGLAIATLKRDRADN
jgi:hypothetical protein